MPFNNNFKGHSVFFKFSQLNYLLHSPRAHFYICLTFLLSPFHLAVPFFTRPAPFFALLVPFGLSLFLFYTLPARLFFVHPENCGLAILHKNCFLPRSAFSSSNLSVVFISTDKWNGCESYPDACIQVVLSAIPLSCAPQL